MYIAQIDTKTGIITKSTSHDRFEDAKTIIKSYINEGVITSKSTRDYDHAIREGMKLWPMT
jgi:hypothetical protein